MDTVLHVLFVEVFYLSVFPVYTSTSLLHFKGKCTFYSSDFAALDILNKTHNELYISMIYCQRKIPNRITYSQQGCQMADRSWSQTCGYSRIFPVVFVSPKLVIFPREVWPSPFKAKPWYMCNPNQVFCA